MTSQYLGELHRQLGDVQKTILRVAESQARTEANVGTFLNQMAVQDSRSTDLEARVRALEGDGNARKGVGQVVNGVISAAVALVVTYVGGGHYKP